MNSKCTVQDCKSCGNKYDLSLSKSSRRLWNDRLYFTFIDSESKIFEVEYIGLNKPLLIGQLNSGCRTKFWYKYIKFWKIMLWGQFLFYCWSYFHPLEILYQDLKIHKNQNTYWSCRCKHQTLNICYHNHVQFLITYSTTYYKILLCHSILQ